LEQGKTSRGSDMLKAIKISSLVLFVVVLSGSVLAMPALQTAFVAQYPDIRESQINNCTTCHMPAVEDFLNPYGLALKEAKTDFVKIEELDSDGDGDSNIEEIKNERFPGSHATFPEYYIFHVDFSKEDPELGKVHFNHEMHTIKESFLSKGRCKNCHGKDLFPKRFDDSKSVRPLAHQLCWRCHETSGSKLAPKDCTECHTGIEGIVDTLKDLLK
jgi:hypothetical protein